jgi:dephospho-CoA kinase
MKIIGLTGGIGSGKSVIAGFLKELGAAVIDADKIGHEMIEPGTPVWQEVVDTFGRDILDPHGAIVRKKLAQIVFSDPSALEKLNRITHPRILAEVKTRLKEYEKQGFKVVVMEAAILIEAGWAPLADEVWLALAPADVTFQRLKQRGLPESEALARIAAQVPGEAKISRAQVVIHNDGSLEDLKAKVEKLFQRI